MEEEKYKKYIVLVSEKSDGPQCNSEYIFLVSSKVKPTIELIRDNCLIDESYCNNITYPGCENCMGSRIDSIKVKPYSRIRAFGVSLIDKINGTIRNGSLDKIHILK